MDVALCDGDDATNITPDAQRWCTTFCFSSLHSSSDAEQWLTVLSATLTIHIGCCVLCLRFHSKCMWVRIMYNICNVQSYRERDTESDKCAWHMCVWRQQYREFECINWTDAMLPMMSTSVEIVIGLLECSLKLNIFLLFSIINKMSFRLLLLLLLGVALVQCNKSSRNGLFWYNSINTHIHNTHNSKWAKCWNTRQHKSTHIFLQHDNNLWPRFCV